MIKFKNLTMKNFLSTGNVTQAIALDNTDLTLILGENLDLGGAGARNGVGKTTMVQALSYALFGVPVNNIRKDNLINRTNTKNMMVTVEFNVDGVDYKIERGRKPNVFKFYVNDVQQKTTEDQQGENKETQIAVERVLKMSPDMFRHIVALNTYTEPFLALKTNEQRDIIEQLLGITLLSEKAETIKELIRQSKDQIQQEDFTVKAIEEANKRVKEQIDSLKRRRDLWTKKHDSDLNLLCAAYDQLSQIDIEVELLAHKDLAIYNEQKKQHDSYQALLARQTAWLQKRDTDIENLQTTLSHLTTIDISVELDAHKKLIVWDQKTKELKEQSEIIDRLTKEIAKESKILVKISKEIETLKDHKCYACGQDFHDSNQTEVLRQKEQLLLETQSSIDARNKELKAIEKKKIVPGKMPKTHYKTEIEAVRHSSEVENLTQQISSKLSEVDPYADQLKEIKITPLGKMPKTHYDSESKAVEHKSKVANLMDQLAKKAEEKDPYSEQICDMEKEALQEINFEKINTITKVMEHQKFLLDLLTSKDSFVRKKILDQNLNYLNQRLTYYLDKIGLPHSVVFKNDLNVEITELGREMDFYNLSRGEMNRLILSLSWSFRDVWENLYNPINLLFVDELLDNGTDSIGIENSMSILKDMTRRRQKSIWLISHKDELISRVHSVLKVVKENGFTSYSTSVDSV